MSTCWAGLGAALMMGASLPALAATPVENYGKLPYIEPSQFELSPLGDRIAFVAANGAGRQLVIRQLADNKTLAAIPLSKPKIRNLEWAGEDHVLIEADMTSNDLYSAQSNIEEVRSTVVIPLNGAKPFVVFKGNPKIWPAIYGFEGARQIGGKWYGYFEALGTRNTDPPTADFSFLNMFRVNLDTGEATVAAGNARNIDRRVIGADGQVVAHSNYEQETGIWSLYAGLNGRQMLTVKTALHEIALAGQGRRPGTVIVSDDRSGSSSIKEYDVVTNAEPEELFKKDSVDGLLHDRNGLLVGAVISHDRDEQVFINPTIKANFERATKPFKNSLVSYVSADATWTKWIILTQGEQDAGTYFMVDLTKGTAEATVAMYPDIDPTDVGPVRMLDYKAGDGMALRAVLTLPPNRPAKNLPVVVLPHGGPAAHDSLGFDWLAQAFASQGYAVIQPNFRGSTGGSAELADGGYGEWGRKMQTDVSDALAELVKQGIADSKRACIVGASYGGYAALAGVTVQHGVYRCAVSYAGPSELNDMLVWETERYGDTSEIGRFWRKFMGAKSDRDGAMRAYSPADLADKADAPILLIHGKLDSRVPVEQSRTMAAALKRAGKPFQYIELDGEDHFLSKEVSRVQMIKSAVEFVKAQNPPG